MWVRSTHFPARINQVDKKLVKNLYTIFFIKLNYFALSDSELWRASDEFEVNKPRFCVLHISELAIFNLIGSWVEHNISFSS